MINILDVANLENDIQVMARIQDALKKQKGAYVPALVVLTRTDSLNPVSHWPPEKYEDKRVAIAEHVESMAKFGIKSVSKPGCGYAPRVGADLHRGCIISEDSPFLYIIPVNVPTSKQGAPDLEHQWNLETLLETIEEQLPNSAKLFFAQAAQRKGLLRRMARDLTRRFSGIAFGIASMPTFGLSDVFVLTPLQMILIAAIGGLSCRAVSRENALEYLAAAGVNLTAATALRALAGFLTTVIGLPIINGPIAATATYGIGRSAETYFFAGELRKPEEFKGEYKVQEQEQWHER